MFLANDECRARKGDECITRTYLKPRIASKDVFLVVAYDERAGSRDLEAVEEAVAMMAELQLTSEECLQILWVCFSSTRRENDRLSLLDADFEIARHVEVFLVSIAASLLTRIFHSDVPVRT